jgi:hypothetical protein
VTEIVGGSLWKQFSGCIIHPQRYFLNKSSGNSLGLSSFLRGANSDHQDALGIVGIVMQVQRPNSLTVNT